jgi:transposase
MRKDLHLSEEAKSKIRKLYVEEGISSANLATRFGVSRKHIETAIQGLSQRGQSLDFSKMTSPGYRNV